MRFALWYTIDVDLQINYSLLIDLVNDTNVQFLDADDEDDKPPQQAHTLLHQLRGEADK